MLEQIDKKKDINKIESRAIPGFLLFALFLIVGISIFSIVRTKRNNKVQDDVEYSYAATIFPIQDVLKIIAKDNLKISDSQIVPIGVDPRYYIPTESDKMKIQSPMVIFKIGAGYDDWVDNLAGEKTVIVDLSSVKELELKESDENILKTLQTFCEVNEGIWIEDYHECENLSESYCKERGGVFEECKSSCRNGKDECIEDLCINVCSFQNILSSSGSNNPYYWISVQNMKKISGAIYAVLAYKNPNMATKFEQNYQSYLQSLDELSGFISSETDKFENKDVFVLDDSLDYFFNEFEFSYSGSVISLKGDAKCEEILNEIKTQKISKVYYSEFNIDKCTELLEKEGILIRRVEVIGGFEKSANYIDLIRNIVSTLKE